MKTVAVPHAPKAYDQREEQVFRDLVRRLLQLAATDENLYLMIRQITHTPEYANDAEAGAAGLTEGQFYHTATGAVMVKKA